LVAVVKQLRLSGWMRCVLSYPAIHKTVQCRLVSTGPSIFNMPLAGMHDMEYGAHIFGLRGGSTRSNNRVCDSYTFVVNRSISATSIISNLTTTNTPQDSMSRAGESGKQKRVKDPCSVILLEDVAQSFTDGKC
jgi:hypothetical protein